MTVLQPMEGSLNLFSRFRLFIIIFLVQLFTGSFAYPININAIYRSACERELGIILYVDSYDVKLLALDGRLRKIPRYEIIYLAYYPLDIVPLIELEELSDIKLVRVETLHDDRISDLVVGWPVDFTEENISFLTLKGKETVISRDSIWGVELLEQKKKIRFLNKINFRYNFVHPYPFAYCKVRLEGNLQSRETTLEITPQQLISDPVIIKKELDRLKEGHEKIKDYNRDQQFYPVPQVYHNRTSLGLWLSGGTRYGGSKNRSNNLSPILVNEYSAGPFGYQQIFKSGNAPMLYSIHEEVQSQLYWRFKADYFHLSIMLDPNHLLVGSNYDWQKGDLSEYDDRVNEGSFLEYGFDYGPFAIHYWGGTSINSALRYKELFFQDWISGPRYGISYHHPFVRIAAYYGWARDWEEVVEEEGEDGKPRLGTKLRLDTFRINVELESIKHFDLLYSFIYRKLSYDDEFLYKSASYTNAFYFGFPIAHRLTINAFLALEYQIVEHGLHSLDHTKDDYFPKGGLNISLTF